MRKTTIILAIVAWMCSFCLLGKGKKITIGWESFPRTLDPRVATDADSQYLADLVHCSLFKFDHKGKLVADLVKTWKWLGNKKIKVNLRDDIKFANGGPVRAEHVKRTYMSLLNIKNAKLFPKAYGFTNLKSVTVKGSSIIFELKKPDAAFLYDNLSIGVLPPEHDFSKVLTLEKSFKGCGHFTFESSSPSDIILSRNLYRKNTISPSKRIEQVVIKLVKEENTRFAKLLKNELDIVQNAISVDNLANIDKYKNLVRQSTAGLRTAYMGFNFRHPLLKRKVVRNAIAMAIDKETIIKYLLNGVATKANTMLPSGHPYYHKDIKVKAYDPQKATKLLDSAGLKISSGRMRFDLNLQMPFSPTRMAVAKAIQSDLKKIGIRVRISSLEWGVFQENVKRGAADMWLLSWIGFKDPDIYRYAFSGDSFPPKGANRGLYHNAALDKLLIEGKTSVNESKRMQVYKRIQEIIADDDPYVFLFHDKMVAVVNKAVKGFRVFADGRYSSLAYSFK
jgi:peptide/nickel transport system substrate-binding protein